MKTQSFILFLTLLIFSNGLVAQQTDDWKHEKRAALLFGLNQPIIAKGFNVEGNLYWNRFVLDYSHGIDLTFKGSNAGNELKDQHLAERMTWTTGFGIGYRLWKLLNLRVEPKWHHVQIYYDDMPNSGTNRIAEYTVFSLGLGAYMTWRPFEKSNNALSGIMINPSLRFWPRVSSTLQDNKLVYGNAKTGRTETHNAIQPGLNNTPLIFNVSIGYSIGLTKHISPATPVN